MLKNLKKILVFVVLSCASAVFAQEELFQIKKVDFISKGKTKESALRKNISDINYKRVFTSQEELEEYLHDIYQNIENTRLLTDIEYSYNIAETTDNGINLIEAQYTFKDSHSMLIFPKPALDTKAVDKELEGYQAKLKEV
uniref:hypothetical protein n=1 Tax=uncultured Treponema sp. TaxID=162155 RepID=UPI00280B9772